MPPPVSDAKLVDWGVKMQKFYELLERSVLISGILSLALTVTACYMWLAGRTVPQELYILLGTVVGFFFGGKVQTQAQSHATHNQ